MAKLHIPGDFEMTSLIEQKSGNNFSTTRTNLSPWSTNVTHWVESLPSTGARIVLRFRRSIGSSRTDPSIFYRMISVAHPAS